MREFAQYILAKLRAERKNYSEDIASGGCRSYEEYQRLCGVIQGLNFAEEHVTTLLEKVEKEDE